MGGADDSGELLEALTRADCRAALVAARSSLASRKVATGPAAVDVVVAALDKHATALAAADR